ncbi:hypothetical protein ABF638_37755, partial [Nostoc sp. CALU 1950]
MITNYELVIIVKCAMQRFFRGLKLSQKIVLPMLSVCLSVFMLGLVVLGNWFTDSLQQNFRQEIESFAERVHQDFQYEQQTLETQIELIANRDMLNQAVEQRDQSLLLQVLLPLKSILKLDWIKAEMLNPNTKLYISSYTN